MTVDGMIADIHLIISLKTTTDVSALSFSAIQ